MKRVITVTVATVIAAGAGYGLTVAYGSLNPAPANAAPADWMPEAIAELPGSGTPLYGESAYADDDGTVRTVAWQHGQVTSASASAVTVRSADGTEWTWAVDGDTKVYKDGKTGSVADIAPGDTVRVAGRRDGDARTASNISDPPPDFTQVRERLRNLPEPPWRR